MTTDNQTPGRELQLVTSAEASELLGVPVKDLRYSAWPQTVRTGGKLEMVTGEAWIYAPTGRLDDNDPHPAVVFHRGVVLGTVADLDSIGGYLSTHRARGGRADLAQVTGFKERRTYPRRGLQARNEQILA